MSRYLGLLSVLLSLLPGLAWAQIVFTTINVNGVLLSRGTLLSEVSAVTNGEWFEVGAMSPISIHISGITTAVVEIDGSNAPTQPANDVHGIKLNATDIASDQIVFVDAAVRWLKVRVSEYTSGTINAYLEGRVPR